MADPTTSNVALAVPLRGSNVGTWDVPVNGDFTSIDGFFGGVATIGLTNVNVTLTIPSGVTISPTAGPTQAQNAVLQFTGTLSANVVVTLPMPGIQTIANFTTGNFTVSFRAVGSGLVVATPQGSVVRVFNDGTDVRFVNDVSAMPGSLLFLGGVSAIPTWITACTSKPYLLGDGTTTYLISDYPALAARYGTVFGGNGLTTFGVPDLQGRVPLAYDGTGTRITTAGCGINGQTLGAAGGVQSVTLDISQIPVHTHAITDNHQHDESGQINVATGAGINALRGDGTATSPLNRTSTTSVGSITAQNTGGGQLHTNVQPAIVTGIWLIKT